MKKPSSNTTHVKKLNLAKTTIKILQEDRLVEVGGGYTCVVSLSIHSFASAIAAGTC